MDYKSAEVYILNRLEKELPANLYYHSLEHTIDVVEAAEKYATMEHVRQENLILLKTAALYHDSGFLIKYSSNEVASVQIICRVLPGFGYTLKQIERISKMILTTEIPQKPKNILERILCDADLDYLGRDDFFMVAIRLFREWNNFGISVSLKEWYIQQLFFLQQHEYFTKSAIKLRNEKKKNHVVQIKELLGDSIN